MKLLSRFGCPLLLLGWLVASTSQVAVQAAAPPELGPAETVQLVATSLSDNKPEVLWQLMPKSYQADINGLISEFAGKMDAELWDSSFNVVKKVVKVLDEKKDFILGHPMVKGNPNIPLDDINKNWEGGLEVFSTLVNSDVSNLEKLKKPDVEGFLSTTGAKLMKQAAALSAMTPDDQFAKGIEKLKSVKVTVVEQDGDTATIKIEADDEEPEEKEMVKVEGRWVPAEMADGWDKNLTQIKDQLSQLSAQDIEAAKAQVMPLLGMVEGPLDSMLAAKTQEEFNDASSDLQATVMGLIMQRAGRPSAPPAMPDQVPVE